MNVLEKILEEIEDVRKIMKSTVATKCFGKECENDDCTVCVYERVIEIICSHMNDVTDINVGSKRLIDANTLDEEVMNFFLTITGNPKQQTIVRECKETFRRMIDEQPTVCTDKNWIPYTEQSGPKKDGIYLVTCDDEEYPVKRMRFKKCLWYWTYGIYDGKILAWQPLPEPYKGEEAAGE